MPQNGFTTKTMSFNNYHIQNDNNDIYSTIIKQTNPQINSFKDQSLQNYSTLNRKLQQNNNQNEQQHQEQTTSRLSLPSIVRNNQNLQKQRPIVTVCFINFS